MPTLTTRLTCLTIPALVPKDMFFHMEDVGAPDLEEGQNVDFDIEQASKGPRTTNVVGN